MHEINKRRVLVVSLDLSNMLRKVRTLKEIEGLFNNVLKLVREQEKFFQQALECVEQ